MMREPLFSRAALYFEEVARRGSIRKAAERLRIAASAVDRQIVQLEHELDTPLFERTRTGLRLTAAGEMLVGEVRRSRREFERMRSQIDDLKGLRRGTISVALVEGAADFFIHALGDFQSRFPAIAYRLQVSGSDHVTDQVIAGECDLGLTFNPPTTNLLRIERTMVYQLGVVVGPDHPLASWEEVSLRDCADFPIIMPDESLSLRLILDKAWARTIGGEPRYLVEANSVALIKGMAARGLGVGMLTEIDMWLEASRSELIYVPLSDRNIELSVLSFVTASGRALPAPAALLLDHLSRVVLPRKTAPE